MPELPEVETTRLGLSPYLAGQRIAGAVVRNRALRWPIPRGLAATLTGQTIQRLSRRAKYLLIECQRGTLIVHLGMSGSLRIVTGDTPVEKHDHFDLLIDNGANMRLTDPRRFGAILWCVGDVHQHKLLLDLGPEPLSESFDGATLHAATRGRRAAIKLAIMDSRIVVGVGNIYASEALFRARISPRMAAGRLSRARCDLLAQSIKDTLGTAIAAGGSSLRNFVHADGSAGDFQNRVWVYDRAGEPCKVCASPIGAIRQGQRSTFYCRHCQR
jgi:formamidopyrimidine-DNA glycosylase